MKQLLTATGISFALALAVSIPQVSALTLYDGTGSPAGQGQLVFGSLNSSGVPLSPPAPPLTPGFETIVPHGVTLTTNANNAEYAGYSNYNPLSSSFVNPSFPNLNQNLGYSVFFNVSLDSTTSNSPNRAAFSVTVIGLDNLGIELGFEANQIFAQNSNFIRAEVVNFNTNNSVDYELRVLGGNYQLFANNSQILTGSLRSYIFNPNSSQPPLGTFNPYNIANFLFLGDNTGQEFGLFTLRSASITVQSQSVPESSSELSLVLLAGLAVFCRYYLSKSHYSGVQSHN